MGWGDDLEARRLKKLGLGDPSRNATTNVSKKKKKRQGTEVGIIGLVAIVGSIAGLKVIWQRLREDRQQTTRGGRGGGSGFKFPGVKGKGQRLGGSSKPAKSSGMSQQSGKASSSGESSGLPRNKMSNNKKNKVRKAEKREVKAQKMADEKKLQDGGAFVTPTANQEFPDKDDIVGGEEGKTFTTTTHTKVSANQSWHRH